MGCKFIHAGLCELYAVPDVVNSRKYNISFHRSVIGMINKLMKKSSFRRLQLLVDVDFPEGVSVESNGWPRRGHGQITSRQVSARNGTASRGFRAGKHVPAHQDTQRHPVTMAECHLAFQWMKQQLHCSGRLRSHIAGSEAMVQNT